MFYASRFFYSQRFLHNSTPLNKVPTGSWGLCRFAACGTYDKHFPRFASFLLPHVHAAQCKQAESTSAYTQVTQTVTPPFQNNASLGTVMLNHYVGDFKSTGKIVDDVPRFLTSFGHQKTAEHCFAVASKATELAKRFNSDLSKAEQAGYLHDVSAIIPNEKRIDFAQSQSVEILAEEIQHPMIIHQKLSVVLAKEVFGVTDIEILSAIGCHTTLKARPTLLDKVIFLADKIAWDQDGSPHYFSKVIKAMDESLDVAVLEYLNYLWERRNQLKVIHPWLIEAREYIIQTNAR